MTETQTKTKTVKLTKEQERVILAALDIYDISIKRKIKAWAKSPAADTSVMREQIERYRELQATLREAARAVAK